MSKPDEPPVPVTPPAPEPASAPAPNRLTHAEFTAKLAANPRFKLVRGSGQGSSLAGRSSAAQIVWPRSGTPSGKIENGSEDYERITAFTAKKGWRRR